MIDIKLLRQDPSAVAENFARRGFQLNLTHFQQLEDGRKKIQTETQELQQRKNTLAKQIGQAKAQKLEAQHLLLEAEQVSKALDTAEAALSDIQIQLDTLLLSLPNLLDTSVPAGRDEADNLEISRHGSPKSFSFEPKDHIALGETLQQMDFAAAAKLSGSRFVVLNQGLARLHRALGQFMLDTHTTEHGYQETYIPFLVKKHCFVGTGQLPKFADDFFMLQGDSELGLISTAEIALTNLARERLFQKNELPIKLTALSPCFRSESGSYGKDTRGMIRQHQFEKVELVQLVHPDTSFEALETLVGAAENILKKLELPYRKVLLCAGDTGNGAAKTYDLEVWLPGQNRYREISSCSNCLDFQARRMQARFKDPSTGKNEYIHTLNGSGLAVGRTLVAILENYQEADGSITIPGILQPYMNGTKVIQIS